MSEIKEGRNGASTRNALFMGRSLCRQKKVESKLPFNLICYLQGW